MESVPLSEEEIRLALKLGQLAGRCLQASRPRIEIPDRSITWETEPGSWAVLPASFNPPTLAHRYMAEWALGRGGFQGVILILDLRHADKPSQNAHIVDRYLMAGLSFDLQDRVLIGLSSHGLFLDKARALSSFFPPSTAWSFLVGEDTAARILDPKFYENPPQELDTLFSEVSFVVFERPGVSLKRFPRRFPRVPTPKHIQGVSSSWVRTRRSLHLPWEEFVCKEVAQFIERTGLYLPEPSPYGTRRRRLEELFGGP